MASRTGSISSSALGEGSKAGDVRASSGAANCFRSFARPILMAYELRPTAAPARLTWRSPISASNYSSRREIGLITNLKHSNGNALGGLGDGELQWHSDQSYMANPATGAGVYAVEIANEGGRTYWTNLVSAYAGLSERLKQAVEGKNAV